MLIRSRRGPRQSRRFALCLEPLEDRNLLSGTGLIGNRWSDPPPDSSPPSSGREAMQQPTTVDRSSDEARADNGAIDAPRTNVATTKVVSRRPTAVAPVDPVPPDEEPPPGDPGESTPPRDRVEAPPPIVPGATPAATSETAERPPAAATSAMIPAPEPAGEQKASPPRSEGRSDTPTPTDGDTEPDALPAGDGSPTVFAVHPADAVFAEVRVEGPHLAVGEPILVGEMPLPEGTLAGAPTSEVVAGLEVWHESWLVDLPHLESLLGAFLAGMERLGLQQVVRAQGTALPLWVLSMGLAAVACEVARRQLRRQQLALAVGCHPRLPGLLVPTPEE